MIDFVFKSEIANKFKQMACMNYVTVNIDKVYDIMCYIILTCSGRL